MGNNWDQGTLGDVAEFIMGQSPSGETCNGTGTGVPLLNGPTEFGGSHPQPVQFTTDPRKFAEAGDLLFCVRGSTTGRMNWADRRYAIGRGLAAIRPKNGLEYRHFVRAIIDSYLPRLLASATGSTFPNVSREQIGEIKCCIPPLAEQKAIAEVLGALDDKIGVNRRMNATLEAMARAMFQSWFVDFDPVRAKLDGRKPSNLDPATAALFPDSFHDSPLGNVPTGWGAISLYDTAQWVNGAAFRGEDFSVFGEGLPVVKIAELKNGISAQTKWSQRDASPSQIIDTGELLYSWSGSPDTSLEAFLWTGGRGLLNQHIFKVISSTIAEKRFVYYLLQYLRPALVEIARNKQTTGLGHVTVADMKRLLVCMPSKAVLDAFDRNIAPIFDRAFANTLESRTLATLRNTLLPKLLSGELHVKDVKSRKKVAA